MGLIGIVLKVAGAIVLVVVGIAAYLYFTDYEARATITDRSATSPCFAVVTPRLAPWIDYRAELSCDEARFVCEDYQVRYRVQTKAFKVLAQDGRTIVYDSQNSSLPVASALDCNRLGLS